MKAREELHRIVDVEVHGNSTLRVAFVEDTPEGPTIVLSHGFGGGDEPFRRPGWCGAPIRLPASTLPQLRAALEALSEGES